ncbi:hypothetical protein CSIRO_3722 [Bradyrhizobiaceae bacterium SG-6C]|nr:hypothetical protein CSIRO_3722 [Bradyrhizobiaceae bacterium SG-6C]
MPAVEAAATGGGGGVNLVIASEAKQSILEESWIASSLRSSQ